MPLELSSQLFLTFHIRHMKAQKQKIMSRGVALCADLQIH